MVWDAMHNKKAEIILKNTIEMVKMLDMEIERVKKEGDNYPSAILSIRLAKEAASHSDMLSSIAELPCVIAIEELIS